MHFSLHNQVPKNLMLIIHNHKAKVELEHYCLFLLTAFETPPKINVLMHAIIIPSISASNANFPLKFARCHFDFWQSCTECQKPLFFEVKPQFQVVFRQKPIHDLQSLHNSVIEWRFCLVLDICSTKIRIQNEPKTLSPPT